MSEFEDLLGGHDRARLEVYLDAMIDRVWIYTWTPRSSELRDALGGNNRASLEMHFEGIIEQDWRCTWRRPMGGGR